jgi:hypothetical protein
MRQKQAPAKKTPTSKKAATAKKKASPKPAAKPAVDSEWAIGPYGDLVSKKDFAPSATHGGTR